MLLNTKQMNIPQCNLGGRQQRILFRGFFFSAATLSNRGTTWYYFFANKNSLEPFAKGDLAEDKSGGLDRILERPYMPSSSTNPRLAECITLYLERYQKKAETKCEEFLNRPESDQDKSIALTVLGVIFDERTLSTGN